jgi:hypothetical protein
MSDNDDFAKVQHEGGEDPETKDDDYEYFDEKAYQVAADQENAEQQAKTNKNICKKFWI